MANMVNMDDTILRTATFDPKLKVYWTISGCLWLTLSMIGIPLVPLWLLFGRPFVERSFASLKAELTPRALKLRHGHLFRVEKTIPLDKIQDMSLHEGPILRHLGLEALRVETAGQSSPQGMPDASLMGIVGARAFRDAVLALRDEVVMAKPMVPTGPVTAAQSPPRAPSTAVASDPVLIEIRDSLVRIEACLREAQRQES